MGSITIVNKTNWPINSSMTFAGVNSSWRNKINENEFFVHSAAGIHTVNVRYYTSINSLYEANWGRIAAIIGEITLNLAALGLTIVGAGPAVAAAMTAYRTARAAAVATEITEKGLELYQAVRAAGAAAVTDFGLKETGIVALDLTALGIDISNVAVNGLPEDQEWTNVHGIHDNAFVVEGKMKGTALGEDGNSFMTLTKKSREWFEGLRQSNEIYELSRRCHRIWYDPDRKEYYYNDPRGFRVYKPDRNEYILQDGEPKPVPKRSYVAPKGTEWTTAATGNDRGDWQEKVHVRSGKKALGIEVRVQPDYGVINARLLDEDRNESEWTSPNMGGSSSTNHVSRATRNMDRIKEINVKEQPGFGVVDLMCICSGQEGMAGCTCDWAVGNKDGTKIYSRSIPEHNFLNGLRGKEQARFGLVDLKFSYKPDETDES